MSRNLRLQVIMGAVDRVTRPLRKIRQGSGHTAEALRATKQQLGELQQQQKDLSGYRRTNAAIRGNVRELRNAQGRQHQYTQQLEQQREAHVGIKASLTTARREYDRLAKAVTSTKQPNAQLSAELDRARIRLTRQQDAFDRSSRSIRQFKDRARNAGEQVKQLTRTHATNTERLGRLKGRLDEAGISTDNLGRSARELRNREQQLNTTLEQQQQRLGRVAAQQRRLNEARDRHQRAMGNIGRMQGVGAGMLGTGVAQGYMASRLLAPGVSWGEQMSTLQAVGRFNADDERYQALRAQSRELGGSTAYSATQVGAGQEFLLRAGMSAEAIQASMRDVLDLATANNSELGRAADIASNIAGTFRVDMEAEGAMGRVADILSGTASRANVNLEMLGETMKYLGGAEDLEMTMEQAAAMAGLLGNVGIQGSQAGTTMRAMMNRLTAPTSTAAGLMEDLGLQVADAQGNMRALPDILRDINQATQEMGNVERKEILQRIFGAEAGSGMAELVNAMGDGALDRLLEDLEVNLGENARMARTMEDNVGGDLKNLRSAWEEIGISIADTNDGPLRDLVQSITGVLRGVGDWIKANPELAGTIAKVAGYTMAIVTAGGALTMMLASILGPVAMLRFGLTMVGIKAGALGSVLPFLGKALGVVGQAILFIGRALLMNPIGLLITAIAGAAYLIYRNWDRLGPWFASLWQGIKDTLGAAWDRIKEAFAGGIGGVSRLLLDWSPLGLLWRGISQALNALGIEVPERFSEVGINIISGIIDGITDTAGALRDTVVALASNIAGWMRDAITGAWDSGIELAQGFAGGVRDRASAAVDSAGAMAQGTIDTVRGWLDIHSPSRVFRDLGQHTMAGFQQGLQRGEDGPLAEAAGFAQRLRRTTAALTLGAATIAGPAALAAEVPLDTRAPLAPQGGGGLTINGGINIEVHPSPGMDEQALARLVGIEVERRLADAAFEAAVRRRSAFHDID
ncbi:phage tail tape measure protein [Halomonas pacifica]|uniref:phage tail tape measure protein n=1 Tax=Bisbaumannia pacifica TaxID=77098 RepID=UPI00235968FB|nr:phage tail tape measure protein [Halomonas pacifica]MDC8802549.1 phage tail tape measure protein [Halomonas pacifica]